MPIVALAVSLASGATWGMAFWSWGLALPIPMRIGATVMLVLALGASSRSGMLAAAAFVFGMGASSGLLLAAAGNLFVDWWGVVPLVALTAGVALVWLALPPSAPAVSAPPPPAPRRGPARRSGRRGRSRRRAPT